MDGGKGGKGGKGWGDSKFPRPAVPNPGLDPQQQTFSGLQLAEWLGDFIDVFLARSKRIATFGTLRRTDLVEL